MVRERVGKPPATVFITCAMAPCDHLQRGQTTKDTKGDALCVLAPLVVFVVPLVGWVERREYQSAYRRYAVTGPVSQLVVLLPYPGRLCHLAH